MDDDSTLLGGVYSSQAYANFNFILFRVESAFQKPAVPRGDFYPKNKQRVFIPFSARDRRVFTGLRATEKRHQRVPGEFNSEQLLIEKSQASQGSYRNNKIKKTGEEKKKPGPKSHSS